MAETVFSKPLDSEVASLNEAIAKQTITVTMNSSISWGVNTQVVARRSANIVVISGVLNVPSGGISAYTQLATISTSKPDTQYWFSMAGPTIGRGSATSTGAIITESALSAGYYSFNVAFAV